MIQLINWDISYSYTCLYPCGEDDITLEIKNDYRSQDANFGLSVSSNELRFIKDDAQEVRNLIDSELDYQVNVNNLAWFQADFANYEDDGIFVTVPLISSGIKDFLRNTTIESLGLQKSLNLAIKKKPQMLFTVAVSGEYGSEGLLTKVSFGDVGSEVISGVLPTPISLPQNETFFMKKELPVSSSRVMASFLSLSVKGSLTLNNAVHNGETKAIRYRLRRQLVGRKSDSSEVVIDDHISTEYGQNVVVGDVVTISFTDGAVANYRFCEDKYNGDDIESAYVRYDLRIECTNLHTLTGTYWIVDQQVTISGEMFTIDYSLPSISMSSIQSALLSQGISLPIISGNYYLASGNIDKLNSTKLLDLVMFFARMKGEVLFFNYDSCIGRDLDYYFNNPLNLGNDYCKWTKKAIPLDFAVKIGKNPSKVRLKNTPEGMWSNTYTVPRTSKLLKQSEIQSEIIYDGAEIVNQLISDSKDVFILDGSNSELVSDDDLPINYSFSAVCIAYNNRERIFSNAQASANSFTPADTTGVVFTIPNHIAGLTTASSIDYASQKRLSPYVIEMDVPMTQAIITQIMTQNYLIAVSVNGTDYYVEECSIKLAPQQAHFSLREIVTTPA